MTLRTLRMIQLSKIFISWQCRHHNNQPSLYSLVWHISENIPSSLLPSETEMAFYHHKEKLEIFHSLLRKTPESGVQDQKSKTLLEL